MLRRLTSPPSSRAFALAAALLSAAPLFASSSRADRPDEEKPGQNRSAPAEAPLFAAAGRWMALHTTEGRILILDLETGRRREWSPPAPAVRALAFETGAPLTHVDAAPSGGPPPPVLVIAAAPGGSSSTDLFRLSSDAGEILSQRHVDLDVAFVLPALGTRRIYVVGRRGEKWSLGSVDLSGESPAEGPFHLPGPVQGAALSPEGNRIYLASEDSIRSFATEPLRSSWQLRSPGPNGHLLTIPGSGEVLASRGRSLALFDPGKLPGRDPVTGAFPTDDAARVIALPFDAGGLAAQADGRLASVVSADGLKLAVVDLIAGSVVEARETAPSVGSVFRGHPEKLSLIGLDGASVVNLPIALAATEPSKTAAAPPGSPDSSTPVSAPTMPPAPATPPTASTSPPSSSPPANPGLEAVPPEPPDATAPSEPPAAAPTRASAPASLEPPAPQPEAASSTGNTADGPPEPTASSPPPPPAPPSATPGMISGRITGEIPLARAIVLYGPKSIFKEFTRVTPAPDGTFQTPLPPPGTYRILLQGAGSIELSYSPPYYQIAVATAGIAGIDFNVAGRIPGTLKR